MNKPLNPVQIAHDLLSSLQSHVERWALPPAFHELITWIQAKQGKLVICGLGKSGHVAHLLASMLQALHIPAHFLHASEALHGDLGVLKPQDRILFFSHSGRTQECLTIATFAKRMGISSALISSATDTPLAHLVDILLNYPPSELCQWNRMPSLSLVFMQVYAVLISTSLQRLLPLAKESYLSTHPSGYLGLESLRARDFMIPLDRIAQIHTEATLAQTLEATQQAHLGCSVVLDAQGKIQGIFTDGDLRRALLHGAQLTDAVHQWMTYAPKSVDEHASRLSIKMLMFQHKISALPVENTQGKLIGLITYYQIDNEI